ncbi:hypothetical protein [Tatumella terrea]|uniref:Uncharacterized protein n=1 Tax=Tatumella terrea TaxID=419007 RepID=A0ABW1VZE3_9GAMM
MRQGILLLIALWSCGVMASEGYRFTLQGRSDIDQEILVAEVVSFHRFIPGTLFLQWYLNDADPVASQLKQRLIAAGVPESSIRSEKAQARENRSAPGLVTVLLRPGEQDTLCQLQESNFRYDSGSGIGCAVENNRRVSEMNSAGRH